MAYIAPHTMSESQLESLVIIERVCSSLSLAGCLMTIVTFASSEKFRKPINRLVLYATFGNMATNVATLMSRTYTENPNSGQCQFQGFLIQMFMPADAYWTLAMAVNVHLTFYHHFDTHKLRRMELPYIIICYGVPFIPALVLLLLRKQDGTRPYGNATLWCWITPDWGIYRIVTFYVPVWTASILTIAIYCRAGKKIFKIRKQLRHFHSSNPETDPGTTTIKTTEVTMMSESRTILDLPARVQLQEYRIAPPTEYSVSVSATPASPLAESSTAAHPVQTTPEPAPPVATSSTPPSGHRHHLHMPHLPHHMHLPYLPHISQLTHIMPIESHAQPRARRQSAAERRQSHAINRAAWSYTKCAMLFFSTMLITWIPSSANRIYSYTHDERSSAVLQYMSAFVLPLQGFWNFAVYAVFSWDAFKDMGRAALDRILVRSRRKHGPGTSALTTVTCSSAFPLRKHSDCTNLTEPDDDNAVEPLSRV
ncbi:hypothetical protein TD95_004127 [Thielaviopsis punctulata]|uniref:G-protein coupled receptors family 2 profile 2 domain-containing protein n=1 Tax=Thielaviopsis punctulata TaxID=72032 RepID=A0A0F4ZCB1_9PEZI|nr:hypothetical protein TD95_004127 [Thielaviopsis punctulata]